MRVYRRRQVFLSGNVGRISLVFYVCVVYYDAVVALAFRCFFSRFVFYRFGWRSVRVVKHLRVVQRLYLLCRLLVVLRQVVYAELHFPCQRAYWVEHSPDDAYRLFAQISEVDYRSKDEYRHEAVNADDVLKPLAAKHSVVAAGVENLASHYRRKELCRCYGEPYHRYHQADEPFQQVDFVGLGKLEACHAGENRYYERRQAEASRYEEI